MRVGTRRGLTAGRICTALLLGLAPVSLVIPSSNVAFSQNLTLKGLSAHASGPVEIILTDPQGRQTGFDPVHSISFHDIPVSAYSTDEVCDEVNGSSCSPPVKSVVMANPMGGQYTLDVIGTGSGDFRVAVSMSDAAGNDIWHLFEGTTAPGVSSRFTFQGELIFFAAFEANLKITSASKAFQVNGTFTLGTGETISPATQPVSVQLGNYFLTTIPAGSFRQSPQGAFVFKGVIKGITMCTETSFGANQVCLSRKTEPDKYFDANLTPTGGNGYAFKVVCAGPTDLPSANPVEVRLAIGNNGGSVSVNGEFGP